MNFFKNFTRPRVFEGPFATPIIRSVISHDLRCKRVYGKYFWHCKVYEIGNKSFLETHLSCFLVVSYDSAALKAS